MHTQTETDTHDTHTQLRALYRSLVDHEERFHEFKQLLAMYPTSGGDSSESDEATQIRMHLNDRIKEWVGGGFEGLSAMQVLLWRSIVVEERFNVALSPWKEANGY